MQPRNAPPYFAGMLMLLLLSATGCATTSPPAAVASPQLPAIPSVSEPQPSQTYSSNALSDIQAWRKKLMDTPLIP